ncbi:MAG TPA: oxygen-independent coproporphyrinogen III oxidase [Hyphomonadaceae bacterium]|jgi:oxygen-independent coproporphyrinogen-3 oxidase
MMTASPSRSRTHWRYLPDLASAQLPRYTSYPPATRFTDRVGPQQAAEALAMLPPDSSLSLYLHIPFCKKLCWYCGCHTSVPTLADPVETYVAALQREIERAGERAPPTANVARIHFGGGSPDILSPTQIRAIFESLRSAFHVGQFAEIAAELDPRGLTAPTVEAFAAAGMTRASLGVQVLDPGVQARINRIQPKEQISAAIALLKRAGVESLNMDMMYGLPGQTTEHVVDTARFAADEDADRVAVFGYAHVPWMKKHQKAIRDEDLAEGEERFRQAEAAAETLLQSGYLPIGFDHFAAPGDSLAAAERQGRLHRNFQGYTDDDTDALLGFGASAISCFPDVIFQNTPDTSAYREAIFAGRSPVVRGVALDADDRRTAALIEGILCDFEARIDGDLHIAACPRLAPFIRAGLVQMHGNHLTVTSDGRPYVRNIAACFDPGFNATPARHSLAI